MPETVLPKSIRGVDTLFPISGVFCLTEELLVMRMVYLDSPHCNLSIQGNLFVPFSVPPTHPSIHVIVVDKK